MSGNLTGKHISMVLIFVSHGSIPIWSILFQASKCGLTMSHVACYHVIQNVHNVALYGNLTAQSACREWQYYFGALALKYNIVYYFMCIPISIY